MPNTQAPSLQHPRSQYKLVLFDFDNTLYVGKKFALRLVLSNFTHMTWVKAERQARKAIAGQDYGDRTSLRNALFSHMAQILHKDEQAIEQWYDTTYLPSMVRILQRSYSARPHTMDLIKTLLAKDCQVGVLSDYPLTRARLEAIGLSDGRIIAWTMEDFGALKPAPRPFIQAANEVSASPSEVLFIGDRADTDGEGALSAGMDCLLIEGKKAANNKGIKVMQWEDLISTLTK